MRCPGDFFFFFTLGFYNPENLSLQLKISKSPWKMIKSQKPERNITLILLVQRRNAPRGPHQAPRLMPLHLPIFIFLSFGQVSLTNGIPNKPWAISPLSLLPCWPPIWNVPNFPLPRQIAYTLTFPHPGSLF